MAKKFVSAMGALMKAQIRGLVRAFEKSTGAVREQGLGSLPRKISFSNKASCKHVTIYKIYKIYFNSNYLI